jgi:tetratricopeptide (TPR) repeat protein
MENLTRKSFFITLVPLLLASCATGKLNLYSNPPKAEVYGGAMEDGKRKLIGVTPMVIRANVLSEKRNGTGPVVLEFRKDGYDSKEVVLTEVDIADLVVSADLTPRNGLADQQTINWVIETMFECQRLVRVKRLDEALSQLNDVQRLAPQIAAVHEMKGGIYYMQRKFADALDSYSTAVKYNPKNGEALRMVSVLTGIVSSRSRVPSSEDEGD